MTTHALPTSGGLARSASLSNMQAAAAAAAAATSFSYGPLGFALSQGEGQGQGRRPSQFFPHALPHLSHLSAFGEYEYAAPAPGVRKSISASHLQLQAACQGPHEEGSDGGFVEDNERGLSSARKARRRGSFQHGPGGGDERDLDASRHTLQSSSATDSPLHRGAAFAGAFSGAFAALAPGDKKYGQHQHAHAGHSTTASSSSGNDSDSSLGSGAPITHGGLGAGLGGLSDLQLGSLPTHEQLFHAHALFLAQQVRPPAARRVLRPLATSVSDRAISLNSSTTSSRRKRDIPGVRAGWPAMVRDIRAWGWACCHRSLRAATPRRWAAPGPATAPALAWASGRCLRSGRSRPRQATATARAPRRRRAPRPTPTPTRRRTANAASPSTSRSSCRARTTGTAPRRPGPTPPPRPLPWRATRWARWQGAWRPRRRARGPRAPPRRPWWASACGATRGASPTTRPRMCRAWPAPRSWRRWPPSTPRCVLCVSYHIWGGMIRRRSCFARSPSTARRLSRLRPQVRCILGPGPSTLYRDIAAYLLDAPALRAELEAYSDALAPFAAPHAAALPPRKQPSSSSLAEMCGDDGCGDGDGDAEMESSTDDGAYGDGGGDDEGSESSSLSGSLAGRRARRLRGRGARSRRGAVLRYTSRVSPRRAGPSKGSILEDMRTFTSFAALKMQGVAQAAAADLERCRRAGAGAGEEAGARVAAGEAGARVAALAECAASWWDYANLYK